MLSERFYKRSALFVAAIFAISLLGWAVIFGLAYKSAIDLRTSISSENSQESSKISKSLGKKFEWVSAASDLPTNVLISNIPVAGNFVMDLRYISHALGELGSGLISASDSFFQVQDEYPDPIYEERKIDVEKLVAFKDSATLFNASIKSASTEIDEISQNGYIHKKFGAQLTQALAFAEAAVHLVDAYDAIGPALGQSQKVNYLVTVGNQAELRASGGAPRLI